MKERTEQEIIKLIESWNDKSKYAEGEYKSLCIRQKKYYKEDLKILKEVKGGNN